MAELEEQKKLLLPILQASCSSGYHYLQLWILIALSKRVNAESRGDPSSGATHGVLLPAVRNQEGEQAAAAGGVHAWMGFQLRMGLCLDLHLTLYLCALLMRLAVLHML